MIQEPHIRRFADPDAERIWALVGAVVSEIYGRILAADFKLDRDTNWEPAWVAEDAGKIVAVMLTDKDWLEDLWIAETHRRQGLGGRLLTLAEEEIGGRGHLQARLRVVAENTRALQFYAHHGWREDRRYLHEKQGFRMVEMIKAVPPG